MVIVVSVRKQEKSNNRSNDENKGDGIKNGRNNDNNIHNCDDEHDDGNCESVDNDNGSDNAAADDNKYLPSRNIHHPLENDPTQYTDIGACLPQCPVVRYEWCSNLSLTSSVEVSAG